MVFLDDATFKEYFTSSWLTFTWPLKILNDLFGGLNIRGWSKTGILEFNNNLVIWRIGFFIFSKKNFFFNLSISYWWKKINKTKKISILFFYLKRLKRKNVFGFPVIISSQILNFPREHSCYPYVSWNQQPNKQTRINPINKSKHGSYRLFEIMRHSHT